MKSESSNSVNGHPYPLETAAPRQHEILLVMSAEDKAMSPKSIQASTGLRRENVQEALGSMLSAHLVHKEGYGKYRIGPDVSGFIVEVLELVRSLGMEMAYLDWNSEWIEGVDDTNDAGMDSEVYIERMNRLRVAFPDAWKLENERIREPMLLVRQYMHRFSFFNFVQMIERSRTVSSALSHAVKGGRHKLGPGESLADSSRIISEQLQIISTRITRLKEERGLSWEEIGASAGVAARVAQQWGDGDSSPPAEKIPALAQLLGSTPLYLLGVADPGEDHAATLNNYVAQNKKAEAEGKMEVVDIDVGPGDYMMRVIPIYDEAGNVEYYIRATYTGLTKEEGEELRNSGG
ncbi:MAG: helix-turn-helix transcriptional regulator [Bacteroidota bacterium]